MGTEPLIYSFVARGTMILAEYTNFASDIVIIAAQHLPNLPAFDNRFSFDCDGKTFMYHVENGITYCVVVVESVGMEFGWAFLEIVKKDFNKRYGGGKAATATSNSLNEEYGSELKKHMQYCLDHPEEVSKLGKLNAEPFELKIDIKIDILGHAEEAPESTRQEADFCAVPLRIRLRLLFGSVLLVLLTVLVFLDVFHVIS
ncbi:hypothetical protein PTKIN_Ptkin12aG0199100 [Pterospermum kingtungense]